MFNLFKPKLYTDELEELRNSVDYFFNLDESDIYYIVRIDKGSICERTMVCYLAGDFQDEIVLYISRAQHNELVEKYKNNIPKDKI